MLDRIQKLSVLHNNRVPIRALIGPDKIKCLSQPTAKLIQGYSLTTLSQLSSVWTRTKVEAERHVSIAQCHLRALKAHGEISDLFEEASNARNPDALRLVQAQIKLSVLDMDAAIAGMADHLPQSV